jgi:hypothetical protein
MKCFFALITFMSLSTTAFAITQCDFKSKVICNDYKAHNGKICSNVCYDRDDVINDKACGVDTARYCQQFRDSGGYVCSNVYCLVN